MADARNDRESMDTELQIDKSLGMRALKDLERFVT